MAREVLVGTSGWSYDDWDGAFYPRGADRLSHYAQRFPAVEVNFTHYRNPADMDLVSVAAKLARVRLQAVVWKAPQDLTHRAAPARDRAAAVEAASLFAQALASAAKRGVHGGILLQFAASSAPEAVDVGVEGALAAEADAPLFVEVRHPAYADAARVAALHERVAPTGGAVVAVDHPGAVVTRALPGAGAYFRFHGRNPRWHDEEHGGVHGSDKYDHLYSAEEVDELAARVAEAQAERVLVFFNNHAGGKAPANARSLQERLGLPRPGPPRVRLDDFR